MQRGADQSSPCNHCKQDTLNRLSLGLYTVNCNHCKTAHGWWYSICMCTCTCEREPLCAAAALPPWCGPLLQPNGAGSGLARRLHLADESLWWFPTVGGMYWCAHTSEKRGMRRGIRLWKNFSHCYDLLISEMELLFCARPAAQHSRRPGPVTAQFISTIEYLAQRCLRLLLQGLNL